MVRLRANNMTVHLDKRILRVRDYVLKHTIASGFHGIDHWDRVYLNAQQLIASDVNPLVVGLFAYLHDACRENDGADIQHGPRAAVLIDNLRGSLLKNISDEDISLLKEACRLHTTCLKTGNPTIDACFDADRLDLDRVGIIPDPDRLATEKGKDLARRLFYQ